MIAPIPSPIWQPAAARVIPISAPANLRTRGLVPEIVTLSWAPKSSADNFDFSLDLSEILSCTADYIASVTARVTTATGSGSDLVVLWVSIVNGLACVFLGSGLPGTTQTVRVVVGTQQGRVIAQEVLLSINSYSQATSPQPVPTLPDGTPVPPNAIRLPDGSILTDDNGQPYIIA
ncbi:phage fiber-tail adaptor protein [Acetobacter senegalensis]